MMQNLVKAVSRQRTNGMVFYLFFAFVFLYTNVFCQKPKIITEIGGYAGRSAQQLPFWQSANQFGIVPQSSPALLGRVEVQSISERDTLHKRRFFELMYGFEAFGTVALKSQIKIVEANIGLRLGGFVLSVGRKKEVYGLIDTLLSTGSVSYSGNALPIPKVQLSTNGFIELPFTNHLLAIQGNFAHGWLGEVRYSDFGRLGSINPENIYFHQKTFYGRFGKAEWKVNIFAGFNHQVYWGNERSYSNIDLTGAEIYKRVLFGQNWAGSKIGNSLGSIDIGLAIKGKKWDTFIYRQNIYDTGSLLNGLNRDGLNGISLRRKMQSNAKIVVKNIVIEYIYTNDQVDPLTPAINGRNNYFNHYIYLDGWTYKARLLGTPLLTIGQELKENIGTNDYEGWYIANNRIYALHLAASGLYAQTINVIAKATLSRNEGLYESPFTEPRYQFSSLLLAEKPLKNKITAKMSIAADFGGLYVNQVGVYVGLLKKW